MSTDEAKDLDVELNGWAECRNAFGVAERTFDAGIARMRVARDEAERDSIRVELHGFCRRLALGMLALSLADDERDLTTTGEKK